MNKNAQTVGLIGFGTVLAGMLAFWLNSNPNRDRPSDPSRTPSPKVQTNSPDAELVGSPTVSVDTREELPKSAESNEPGPDNIDKDVDPKLGRHLWTDAELGLDLSGPWEEIDMNDYMFTAKPLGPPLNLTSAQITARRGRLLELWYKDEAYWASRSNELALLDGIRVLRDPKATSQEICGHVANGMMIATYWLLKQAGLTRDLENGASVPQEIAEQGFDTTGTVGAGNIYAAYGYNDEDFPLFGEWDRYKLKVVNALNKYRKEASKLDPDGPPLLDIPSVEIPLANSLRSQLLDALEFALAFQKSVTPKPNLEKSIK
ncbi:MAG: hypothetical protein R3F33_03910 [Planctomycetota bacterium]